jgi:peptidyl-prolyl cis-trans isomerase-like 4
VPGCSPPVHAQASLNFIKLCKRKYYNNCLFHSVEKDFIAQSGDPSNTGKGGESVFGLDRGADFRFFEGEGEQEEPVDMIE